MGLIRRTPTSRRDYSDIWFYIAEHGNPDAADNLLRAFDAKLQLISDFPGIGAARPELRPRLRSFPVGNYLLFYRPIRGGIELVRVVHGARKSTAGIQALRSGLLRTLLAARISLPDATRRDLWKKNWLNSPT